MSFPASKTTYPIRAEGDADPAGDHNQLAADVSAIVDKLGLGDSPASAATTGQVLTKKSDGTTGYQTPASGSGLTDPTTTKGDILARTSSAVTRLPVGTDGQALVADSTAATGLKYATISGGASSATFSTEGIAKRQKYNSTDYGATGDGTTDDGVGINAAIAAASAAGGGVVVLPRSNTVKITTSIVPANNVSIEGHGRGVTTLMPTTTNPAIKLFGTTSTPLIGVTFSNFTIDGANQTVGGGSYTSGIKGIYITYLQRCTFRDIHVKNTGATGIGNDFHRDCFYINCLVENGGRLGSSSAAGAAGMGIGVSDWCTGAKFVGCVTRSNMRAGIFFETQNSNRATGYIVTSHLSESNGDCGIGDAGCDGLQVIGGIFRNNTKAGITSYEGTIGAARNGNNAIFIGCDVYGNGTSGYVCLTSPNLSGGTRFINCKFHENTQYGLSFANTYDTAHLAIIDSEIYLNGLAGIKMTVSSGTYNRFAIRNNRIYNNGTAVTTDRYGIFISGNYSTGSIYGNMIFDDQATKTQQYAVVFDAGVSIGSGAWQMRNNDLRSNLVAPVLIDATTTINAPANFSGNLGLDTLNAISSAYAIIATDRGNTLSVSGNTTLTLPTAVSRSGFRVTIVKTDSSATTTTLATSSSQTINGATTQTLTTQYAAITVESNGTNWYIVNKV